jgi:hypothetical protein
MHPSYCPLRSDCVALELQTSFGSRWYGVKRAWIGSDLQMRVEPEDSRFEEMNAWKDAPIDTCSHWTESISDPMCDKCQPCIIHSRALWYVVEDNHPFNRQQFLVIGDVSGQKWVLLRYWPLNRSWTTWDVTITRAKEELP